MIFDDQKDIEFKSNDVVTADPAPATVKEAPENDYYIKFKKPFFWEDETYEGVDLSGLENLSARDMIATQRAMERSGSINVLPEMSLEYACIFAARATGLPQEFFQSLPPREAIRVKNKVTSFFYGEE